MGAARGGGDPHPFYCIRSTHWINVIPLTEERQVLLLRQYRHPVGMYLWEPPAGLLDDPAESPLRTAQRELVEEAGAGLLRDLRARDVLFGTRRAV